MTLYDVLGVHSKSTKQEIKEAYENLLKTFHPDYYVGNKEFAEKKTQEIVKAYRVLSNHNKRAKYDAALYNANYKKEYEYQQTSSQYNYYSEPQQGSLEENLFSNEEVNDSYYQLKQESNNYDFSKQGAKLKIKNSPLPMSWFKFYINVYLPILLTLNIIYLFTYISDTIDLLTNLADDGIKTYLVVMLAVVLIYVVLLAYSALKFRTLKPKAYKLNILFLILYPAISATSASASSDPSLFTQMILLTFQHTAIFVYPNLIYFEKRRFLFEKTLYAPGEYSKNNVFKYLIISIVIALACASFYYFAVEERIVDNYANIYYMSVNGDVYHKYNCKIVNNIKEENLRYVDGEYKAIELGYKPCETCKP